MSEDWKIALDAISNLFEFDKDDPPRGQWPRKVRNNEMPPKPLGLTYAPRDAGLPFRELVFDGNGWKPWQAPRTQRQIEADMLREDLDMMRNFLREGSIAPPDKKK
jgi:hypothetical protein